MRTTLNIDDDVLRAAKEIARLRGNTAGAIVSELEEDLRPDESASILAAAVESIPDADAHPELYPQVALAREVLS